MGDFNLNMTINAKNETLGEALKRLDSLEAAIITNKEQMDANINAFFLVMMGMLIYLMQCGFAFLEAGSVRSKNTVNILIKNLLDSFVSGLSYWLVGYAFAFGEGNPFIGYRSFFAHSDTEKIDFAYFFFQFVFAATAATIVSGAVAERCDFNAYLVYSFILTGFVYPVVTHWAWYEDGWLKHGFIVDDENRVVFQDFAGSGVVHTVGGVVAFVGALILGARKNRFDEYGNPKEMRGHSLPLASLGGFILLFGFFAFNGGSQGEISSDGAGKIVARAIVNTILAATGGAFTTLILNKTNIFGDGKWSLLTTINGCLAGMVSVCAGCDAMYSYGAYCIGLLGGLSYMFVTWAVLKLRVDDPLDACAVHFGGGIVGVIFAPFFDTGHGIFYYGDRESGLKLAWNIIGLLAIIGWSAFFAVAIFGSLRLAGIYRVSDELEEKGLDWPKHGENAYPAEAYGHGWKEKGEHIGGLIKSLHPKKEGLKKDQSRGTTPEVQAMQQSRDSGVDIVSEISRL